MNLTDKELMLHYIIPRELEIMLLIDKYEKLKKKFLPPKTLWVLTMPIDKGTHHDFLDELE